MILGVALVHGQSALRLDLIYNVCGRRTDVREIGATCLRHYFCRCRDTNAEGIFVQISDGAIFVKCRIYALLFLQNQLLLGDLHIVGLRGLLLSLVLLQF